MEVPLEPFVAFGLFLTQQARSIITAPCNDDPTIKLLLYSLANEHHESIAGNQKHLIEVIGQMCDHQNSEYERLLELIDNNVPASVLIDTIKSAQSRTRDLKRKYAEIDEETDETDSNILEATEVGSSSSPQQVKSPSSLSYEKGMQFVEQFKQARIAEGLTKMDWLTCLSEGKKKEFASLQKRFLSSQSVC